MVGKDRATVANHLRLLKLPAGCGRMGSAMLAGWREQGLAPSFAVDPAPAAGAVAGADLTVVADIAAVPAAFAPAAVVFAPAAMLLGVDEQLRDVIRAAGHNLRVYIPFGRDWYAYSVRRLKENPRLAGYVFKSMFT